MFLKYPCALSAAIVSDSQEYRKSSSHNLDAPTSIPSAVNNVVPQNSDLVMTTRVGKYASDVF